jgi:hypothetical protein
MYHKISACALRAARFASWMRREPRSAEMSPAKRLSPSLALLAVVLIPSTFSKTGRGAEARHWSIAGNPMVWHEKRSFALIANQLDVFAIDSFVHVIDFFISGVAPELPFSVASTGAEAIGRTIYFDSTVFAVSHGHLPDDRSIIFLVKKG